jgi:hypothetical protein
MDTTLTLNNIGHPFDQTLIQKYTANITVLYLTFEIFATKLRSFADSKTVLLAMVMDYAL